jgi:hypothetical protein
MSRMIQRTGLCLLLLLSCAASIAPADAVTTSGPAVQPGTTGPAFWPDLSLPNIAWFATVVILALTIRIRPLLALRALDGIILAGMCLLFVVLRLRGGPADDSHTWTWWAAIGLTVAAGYWVIRGISLLLSRQAARHPGTISSGVRLVLVVAGVAICCHQLVTAPLSDASRAGVVGGIAVADTGKLPYGEAAEYESLSPLVYLAHAPLVEIVKPIDESGRWELEWSNRERWLGPGWIHEVDLTAARCVNAILFILLGAGLYVIGARLQGAGSGWIAVAILCAFPGTIESLPRPDIMLPATLLTWSVAFALIPGIGGLLSMIAIILAGVAWPWAWLAVPILLVYFWRHGWQAFSGTLGLLAGIAACLFGLTTFVSPTLPREAGAMAVAGLPPTYDAEMPAADTLVITPRDPEADVIDVPAVSRYLWHPLLTAEATPIESVPGLQDEQTISVEFPAGQSGGEIMFRQVAADGRARMLLQNAYRQSLRDAGEWTRILVTARSVLESTWRPIVAAQHPAPSTWDLWSATTPPTSKVVMIRRAVKAIVALLVIWATLAILLGEQSRPRHLIGALLMVAAGTLIASETGATTYLVWIIPLVASLWVIHEPTIEAPPRATRTRLSGRPAAAAPPPGVSGPPLGGVPRDPAPRITLDPNTPDDPT